MAKAFGIIKVRGAIDDLSFRQTEFGNEVGRKPGPTRERVLHHERFHNTRLNLEEFKRSMEGSKLLRKALAPLLAGRKGSALNGRMNGLLYRMAMGDSLNRFGERGPATGDATLLNGFEFNKALGLDMAVNVPVVHAMDVDSGVGKAVVPSFVARKRAGFPVGATHFRAVSGLVAIDFARKSCRQDFQYSEMMPLRMKTADAMTFDQQVKVLPGEVLVQVLGMEFYRQEGEEWVLLKGTILRIVEAVRKEMMVDEVAVPVVAPVCEVCVVDGLWQRVLEIGAAARKERVEKDFVRRAMPVVLVE
ncbi:hypothetical protein [Paraflavitalea pollutisoli]|uniref:hypothetical protein n=1 Tax=Paraflavitalea pollutisoli TaxID=3034143 RepID=UPI0023ECD26E|nr:hypothetical protein [Paraflavitalea sp. H1-2-19X]